MKVREAKALGTLPDPKFFAAVAEGIGHVLTNATRLDESARVLRDARRPQATRILSLLAEEEAAKCLILVDAVRCPRTQQDVRSRQLGYFNDHLARGIYAELAGAHPMDFAELERLAAIMRKTHYLDGPNDVDWIFRNQILAQREDAIYVDYVEADGEHSWHEPRDDEMLLSFHITPPSLAIAKALHACGLTSAKGLEAAAALWRKVNVDPALTGNQVRELNLSTFEKLESIGVAVAADQQSASTFVNRWQFPLYPLDLRPDEVDQKALEEARRRWHPDW